MSDKSEEMQSIKEVTVDGASHEDILNQSKNVAVKILMLRYSLAFILCALAAGLGASSFLLLRYREQSTFQGEFQSATIQTTRSISQSLQKIYVAANLINDIYTTELITEAGAMLPNYTLPGFEKIVDNINKLSNVRVTSFSPLVTTSTRASWEAYATANVGLLNGPASLTTSINGSWIVADGIYTTQNGKQIPAPTRSTSSKYPNLLFPIWDIAPLINSSAAVMFDPHSDQGTRMQAIDKVVETLDGASSDIVQLVFDKKSFRPSTILYFPVTNTTNIMVGLLGIAFTWDQVFTDVLPSYLSRIDCVVSTATTSFTIAFDNGKVAILGQGDLHDRVFDQYAEVITAGLSDSNNDLAGYTITLYPSEALYSTYITSYPQNVCVGAVVIIAFTALVFTLYVYLVNIRQANLEEVATRSLIRDTSRDAVLQSKKIYVRYISHEMRTPLNVAFLGLKLLNKDLARDPINADRLETVGDISKACHMALSILNDLLNYDKLEDGTLLIEPQRMVALPFILESTEVLNLQAKEKGLVLLFDVYDSPTLGSIESRENLGAMTVSFKDEMQHKAISNKKTLDPPGGISSYLTSSDHINVDPYKMNQVIGNLISNAIKFTPVGQSVTIKARKVMPDMKYIHMRYPSSNASSKTMLSKMKRLSTIEKISVYTGILKYMNPFQFKQTGQTGNTPHTPHTGHNGDVEYDLESNNSSPSAPSNNDNSHESIKSGNHSGHLSGIHSHSEDKAPPLAFCSSGYLVVEVSDSGVGMAPEDSKRLFKEIVQFNPSKLQAGGGSGLGMMITKGIVDLHGGEISVYSAGEGFGSTFTLKIPLLDTPDLSRNESLADDDRPAAVRRASISLLRAENDDNAMHGGNPPPPNHPDQPHNPNYPPRILSNNELVSIHEDDRTHPNNLNQPNNLSHPNHLKYDKHEHNGNNEHKDEEEDIVHHVSFAGLIHPGDHGDFEDEVKIGVSPITPPTTPHPQRFPWDPLSITPLIHDTIPKCVPLCTPQLLSQTSLSFRNSGFLSPGKMDSNYTILVVDDSKLNRRMLIKSLKAGFHQCEEAEDGEEAVNMVRKKMNSGDGVFDAILMDFMMPNMDGPTATRKIRNMGYSGIIIGVTGNALPSDVSHFTTSGADKVLLKPVDMDALQGALLSLLTQYTEKL